MRRALLSMLALAALGACGGGDEGARGTEGAAPDTTAVMADAAPPAADSASGQPTDPQIAAIVVAANAVDSANAELALAKTQNAGVKEFAQRMITDHGGVNRAAVALVTKLGVTPEENATSRELTRGGEQTRASLQGKSGAEFDRGYVDAEVSYHQAVLDAIDRTLIPGARNAELKALLEQTRPAVEAHLQHARQLRSSLGQG